MNSFFVKLAEALSSSKVRPRQPRLLAYSTEPSKLGSCGASGVSKPLLTSRVRLDPNGGVQNSSVRLHCNKTRD